MFRYVLAMLLVNTYSRSFGNPIGPSPSVPSPLSNSLAALATHCENSFLTAQIHNKLSNCSIVAPPYNERQFECLIFLDINSQLCKAIADNTLSLSENSTSKINEPVDVEKLCATAKLWNVSNIVQYPLYKSIVEKVFNNPLACAKVCGVDDILNQDANFYCKYYKWGSELLTEQVKRTTTQISNVQLMAESSSKVDGKLPPIDNVLLVNNSGATNQNEQSSDSVPSVATNLKTEESSKIVGAEPENNIHPSSTNKQSVLESADIPVRSPSAEVKPVTPEQQVVNLPINGESSMEGIDKPSAAEIQQQDKTGVKLEETLHVPTSDQKDSVIEKSKPQSVADPDEYQNSEEREGLMDSQGDDDGDENMLSDPDIKQDIELAKNTPKRIESPIGELEVFPNAIQDGFSDDDDHFFPFFLTAVILIVLLYVLYHNKSKVSKVFLGLIVEGRQPGRRRNSRGHAYRRLDTLEQAMSANTAAPPSKIIY